MVRAAGFEEMRVNAVLTAPDPADILKDRSQFFRRGSSGAGREVLTPDETGPLRGPCRAHGSA